jgi:hypothetical protein
MYAIAEWKVIRNTVFVFYGSGGDFSQEDYDRWIEDLTRSQYVKYIGGTGAKFLLNGSIRKGGREFFVKNKVPFATVTDDKIVRGFVTAASWFGMNIAAFAWSDSRGAMKWLGVDNAIAHEALAALQDLRISVEEKLRQRETAQRVA